MVLTEKGGGRGGGVWVFLIFVDNNDTQMLLLSFVNLNGETWRHKREMRTWRRARVGDFEGHGERVVHSWRVPSKVCYESHFTLHPGLSLIFYFRSFLLNCLQSRLCYQCNFFYVAFPIFFMICSNLGLADLAIQYAVSALSSTFLVAPSC
jgi:hypothetical protein